MADKKQKIILSFVVDKASLKQAQAAIAGLNKSFVLLDKAAADSSQSTAGGVKEVAKATESAKSSVAELSEELSNRVAASANEVKRIMQELGNVSKKSGKEGKKAFLDLDKASADALEEFQKIVAKVNDLEGDTPPAIKKITKEVSNLNKELQKTGKEVGEIPKSFDEVSREVAAFGDIETAGRTVGGAIGVIPGLEGVERSIAALAEIPATLEAIPKFSAGLREARSQIVQMAGGAGKASLAIGGVVAAFATVAVFAGDIIGGLNEQTRIAETRLEGIRAAEEIIAGGDIDAIIESAELAEKNLALAREQNELDKERIANAEAEIDARSGLRGEVEKGIFSIVDASGIIGTPLDKLKDAAKESGDELTIAAESQRVYTEFLATTEGQALLAARALEELNQQIFDNAKAQADIVRFTLDQQDKTVEQLQSENREREKSLKVIEAEILAINQAGEANEQTIERIGELVEAGNRLRGEMKFVTDTAIPAAQALEDAALAEEERAEAAEETAKALEKAAEEAKAAQEKVVADEIALGQERANAVVQTLQQIAEAEKNHADELIKLSEQAAEAERKVLENLQDRLIKLREDAGRREADAVRKEQEKALEAQIKSQRQAVDDAEKHVRQLQDIRTKADESEQALQQKRDFRGVVNARRTARIQIQDAQKNFTQQQKDRAKDEARAREDRVRAFAQERNDRMRKFQQDINDARMQAQKQRIDAINAGRQAIMDARTRQAQELMDIRNSGIRALELRKQLSQAELQMIGQMTGSAMQLFGQLSTQLASFAGVNTTTVSNTTNANTNTTNNVGTINVGQQNNLSEMAILAGLTQ